VGKGGGSVPNEKKSTRTEGVGRKLQKASFHRLKVRDGGKQGRKHPRTVWKSSKKESTTGRKTPPKDARNVLGSKGRKMCVTNQGTERSIGDFEEHFKWGQGKR